MRATRLFTLASWLMLSTCQLVDPNQGTFACARGEDCIVGFHCVAQAAGGGFCFPNGSCDEAEVCDGVDQNCDGRTDEAFPEQNSACTSTEQGVCAQGSRTCVDGALGCMSVVSATTEVCNQLDDDCDGSTDETFDLQTDESHCGACGTVCSGGTICLGGACLEVECGDAQDDDRDGLVDCADPDCLGRVCGAGQPEFLCALVFPDAGSTDAGAEDAGSDAGSDDAGDAGEPDAGDPDAGVPDAGVPDAGVPDAGVPDAGFDAGVSDAGGDAGLDAGPFDAGPTVRCVQPGR